MFNNNKIKRNWKAEEKSKGYLTFTANTANSTLKIVSDGSLLPSTITLEYSNDGLFWSPYTVYEVIENGNVVGLEGQTIALYNIGDYVIFRNTGYSNQAWANFNNKNSLSNNPSGWYKWIFTGELYCSGNIMSLFSRKLSGDTPAGAFYRMFAGCTQLLSAPYIGSVGVLGNRCYANMFEGCTNITYCEFPDEVDISDKGWQFAWMFYGCSSLEGISGFKWKSIANAATAKFGIEHTFTGCTSLKNVPTFKHTTGSNLAGDSYLYGSFQNCTEIEDASELDIIGQYNGDRGENSSCFDGCTKLKYAPYTNKVLISQRNEDTKNFFRNCTSLKEIIHTPSNHWWISYNTRYKNVSWCDGVSNNGTIFLMRDVPKIRSKHYIPFGWNIEEIDDRPLCFEAVDAGAQIRITYRGVSLPIYQEQTFEYSTDAINWSIYEIDSFITLANVGDKVYFRNIRRDPNFKAIWYNGYRGYAFGVPQTGMHRMKCSGNIYSIARYLGAWNNGGVKVDKTETYYSFYLLFGNCRGMLTSLPTLPDYDMGIQPQQYGSLLRSSKYLEEVTISFKKAYLLWNAFANAFAGTSATNTSNIRTVKIHTREANFGLRCLHSTFMYCPNIDRIEVWFKSWTDNDSRFMNEATHYYTWDWLVGSCKPTGVFVHPKGLRTDIHNDCTFPEGWTTRTWEEEICSKYQSVADMVQQYQGLGDVIDTYPNLGEILNQYPGLVHSLVNTGYRPTLHIHGDYFETGVYPNEYMEMEIDYKRNSKYDWMRFGMYISLNNVASFGLYMWEGSDKANTQIHFGYNPYTSQQQYHLNETGEHIIVFSKNSATMDGEDISSKPNVSLNSFENNTNLAPYYISILLGSEGRIYNPDNPNKHTGTNPTFNSGQLYYCKLRENGVLTHHYVPIADRVIADIADLDNIKIIQGTLATDEAGYENRTSVFGLEQI